jgi:hypothetical protein
LYHKRREECVLFLEDCFGSTTRPQRLRDAGYKVKCFVEEHFCDKKGRKEERVKDPRIISLCAAQNYVLVTPDKNMLYTHAETIRKTDIAIIASVAGTKDIDDWITQLIEAKAKIERHVKKTPRPWFMRLGLTGSINVQTIKADRITRRRRPREGQEK